MAWATSTSFVSPLHTLTSRPSSACSTLTFVCDSCSLFRKDLPKEHRSTTLDIVDRDPTNPRPFSYTSFPTLNRPSPSWNIVIAPHCRICNFSYVVTSFYHIYHQHLFHLPVISGLFSRRRVRSVAIFTSLISPPNHLDYFRSALDLVFFGQAGSFQYFYRIYSGCLPPFHP